MFEKEPKNQLHGEGDDAFVSALERKLATRFPNRVYLTCQEAAFLMGVTPKGLKDLGAPMRQAGRRAKRIRLSDFIRWQDQMPQAVGKEDV